MVSAANMSPGRRCTHLSAHLQLDNLDLACNHGRFVSLVECVVEHVDRIGVELVGKTGPLEGERHGRLDVDVIQRNVLDAGQFSGQCSGAVSIVSARTNVSQTAAALLMPHLAVPSRPNLGRLKR